MLSRSVAVILAHPIDFTINTLDGFIKLAIEPYELQTGWQGLITNPRAFAAIKLVATAFQCGMLAVIWIGVFRALWRRPRDWERWILLGAALMLILPPALYANAISMRFRSPAIPFFAVLAGIGLLHKKFRPSMKDSRRRPRVHRRGLVDLSSRGHRDADDGYGRRQGMLMPPPSWGLGYAAVIFAMWTVMMVAMMIPSAAPTILRVAAADAIRQRKPSS